MRPMPELKIEVVRTEDLLPYAGNAKIHTAEQIEQIAASIQEFGNNDPIAVWHNEDGEMEIVEGHGRLAALNLLGIEHANVIYLDHLTDEQRRAYTIIHNKLTMSTGFDIKILSSEISKITDIDLSIYRLPTHPDDIEIDDIFEDVPTSEDSDERQAEPTLVTCPHCGYVQEV